MAGNWLKSSIVIDLVKPEDYDIHTNINTMTTGTLLSDIQTSIMTQWLEDWTLTMVNSSLVQDPDTQQPSIAVVSAQLFRYSARSMFQMM